MNQNNNSILFDINNFPVKVEPSNGSRFTVEEVYELLKVSEEEDLDRIEVFNGAIYCSEIRESKKLNNSASEFWFDNAPHMDRDGIVGNAMFITKSQDLYFGIRYHR